MDGELYHCVTVSDWYCAHEAEGLHGRHETAVSARPLPLIDLRPPHEYKQRRIRCATGALAKGKASKSRSQSSLLEDAVPHLVTDEVIVVNLPLATLLSGERSCELPPRHVDFAILVPHTHCKLSSTDVDGIVEERWELHASITELFFSTRSRVTHQSRMAWRVKQILCERTCFPHSHPPLLPGTQKRTRPCTPVSFGDIWDEAEELGILAKGEALLKGQPPPRLWQPDQLMRQEILPYLLRLIKSKTSNERRTGKSENFPFWEKEYGVGICCDLGCGAGRDVCFLAEELQAEIRASAWCRTQSSSDGDNDPSYRGRNTYSEDCWSILRQKRLCETNVPLKFVAFDNHKGSARRCMHLWKHRGVSNLTEFKCLNLSKIALFHEYLSQGNADIRLMKGYGGNAGDTTNTDRWKTDTNYAVECNVILCFCVRYLNRKLLAYFVSSQCPLQKGAAFAMSHFCKPSDESDWPFDHPKEKYVLERTELRSLFEKSGRWEVLKDMISLDGDHGRTMIHFMARKL